MHTADDTAADMKAREDAEAAAAHAAEAEQRATREAQVASTRQVRVHPTMAVDANWLADTSAAWHLIVAVTIVCAAAGCECRLERWRLPSTARLTGTSCG